MCTAVNTRIRPVRRRQICLKSLHHFLAAVLVGCNSLREYVCWFVTAQKFWLQIQRRLRPVFPDTRTRYCVSHEWKFSKHSFVNSRQLNYWRYLLFAFSSDVKFQFYVVFLFLVHSVLFGVDGRITSILLLVCVWREKKMERIKLQCEKEISKTAHEIKEIK